MPSKVISSRQHILFPLPCASLTQGQQIKAYEYFSTTNMKTFLTHTTK